MAVFRDIPKRFIQTVPIFLAAVAGCSSPTVPEPDPDVERCPIPAGEFGPIGCAVVRGVGWLDGQRLVETPMRGDSCNGVTFVGPYGSSTARTDQAGAFSLKVSWIEPLSSSRRTPPDTATIELRVFRLANPSVCAPAFAYARVLAHFAANGEVVRLTEADSLVFSPFEEF